MARAQQLEEVAAALGSGGAEPGKMGVADLRAEAVRSFMASPGVVHRDPGGAGEPGTQHITGFIEEAVLAGDQQTHELALGDHDAERAQQRQQPRDRDLPLMILGEHEAAQFRAKMPVDAGRQRRRCGRAVRRLPALATEIHHMRTDHQVLHHKIRVPLEARTLRRRCHLDGSFLVDRQLRRLAALPERLASRRRRRFRLGRLVHPAGFDIRPPRPALQPGDLVALRRNCSPQLGHFLKQLQHQAL